MKNYFILQSASNQHGIALISSLMLLIIVSLLAVAVSMDTSMDVRIAAYQRFKAESFGFAESGLIAAADILEENAREKGWDNPSPPDAFPYPNLSDLYQPADGINILQDGVFYMDENPTGNRIMEMQGDIEADITNQRVVSKYAEGASIEVLTGYEGAAKSAAGGGVNVMYNIFSTGRGKDNAETESGIYYRLVVYN